LHTVPAVQTLGEGHQAPEFLAPLTGALS
jgi:hypothetical protein